MTITPDPRATTDLAAELATVNVPIAEPTARASAVRAALEGRRFDSVSDIAVCTNRRLVGLVAIERLLAAPGERTMSELMDPDPPSVAPGVDRERAAWTAVQHGESSLAIVDDDGTFRGLIPPPRLLEVVLAEHAEDLSRLGGFLHDAETARRASVERVGRRIWHRLPWLVLGLAGAMLAAVLVSSYETQLREEVIIAFFVPGIVYMADAVGTQTETLLIRGLSVGVPIRGVVRQELLTGLGVGAVLAVAFVPLSILVWNRWDVSAAVSIALFAACSTATIIAMALPWLFTRAGRDPAFGSGPLATVAQDLLSLLIYLVVASAVVS